LKSLQPASVDGVGLRRPARFGRMYRHRLVFAFRPAFGLNKRIFKSGVNHMRKLVVTTLLASLAILTATVINAAEDTPKAFLEKLYAAYTSPKHNGVDIDTDKAMARYFTPEVIKLMDKMFAAAGDGVPALDGDPFIDAQDWDIKSFAISVDQAGDANKAVGHVSFKNFDDNKSITLDLVRLKAGWRIDDIHWPDGTLRKLLTEPQPN
jgi:hypothetical protein